MTHIEIIFSVTPYCWVIFTLSTAASTRLAPEASAASIWMRMDCPAYALRLMFAVAHAASSSAVLPSS